MAPGGQYEMDAVQPNNLPPRECYPWWNAGIAGLLFLGLRLATKPPAMHQMQGIQRVVFITCGTATVARSHRGYRLGSNLIWMLAAVIAPD